MLVVADADEVDVALAVDLAAGQKEHVDAALAGAVEQLARAVGEEGVRAALQQRDVGAPGRARAPAARRLPGSATRRRPRRGARRRSDRRSRRRAVLRREFHFGTYLSSSNRVPMLRRFAASRAGSGGRALMMPYAVGRKASGVAADAQTSARCASSAG